MEFPYQVFICMLFGVICVVFIVWVLRQNGDPGFITTTEYTVPVAQTGETQPPAFSPPFGDISFTNMRLLVYYAHIAVVAASGREKLTEENITSVREKAIDVVDYRINEQFTPLF